MPKSKHRRKPSAGASKSGTTGVSADVKVSDKAEDSQRSKEKTSPIQFFRQVRDEAKKITWTSRNETMISTIMVLIMVVIMSIFFFSVDEVLRRVVPMILNITA